MQDGIGGRICFLRNLSSYLGVLFLFRVCRRFLMSENEWRRVSACVGGCMSACKSEREERVRERMFVRVGMWTFVCV